MTALQKSVQCADFFPPGADSSTFQDTLKNSYSHGLEKIYRVETIDLKTVRRFSQGSGKDESSPEKVEKGMTTFDESFDLGEGFRDWITSPLLEEPISVLHLPKPLEKQLLERGMHKISDLEEGVLLQARFPHGQQEEIQRRKKEYLTGKPLLKTTEIDFLSIIKCLFGDLDPARAFLFLDPLSLASWIQLTPSEKVDLKKINDFTRKEWIKGVVESLNNPEKSIWLKKKFRSISMAFLIPFIEKRGGIASHEELIEMLLLRASNKDIGKRTLDLLESLKPSLFDFFESLPSNKLAYFAREDHLMRAKALENIAKSYFPTFFSIYKFDEIHSLLQNELAKQWVSLSEEYLKAYFWFSPDFTMKKEKTGEWTVSLCPFARACRH